jgi:glutathione S-transferase
MLLYNSAISGNCYKVRLLLAHLGIAYETREVDVVDRSDPREFLDGLNPARRVPTIVLDDGRSIAESNAIIWFFGEGTRFVPADRFDRTKVLQWLFFEQYDHEPTLAVARFLVAYSGRPREQWADHVAGLQKRGAKALRAMDQHLEGREWFVGDAPTLADIALYAYTHVAPEGGFDLEPLPNVRAWLDRFASMPGHVPIDG